MDVVEAIVAVAVCVAVEVVLIKGIWVITGGPGSVTMIFTSLLIIVPQVG
jgi:hypothetical protein